jgi:hypothetical protein
MLVSCLSIGHLSRYNVSSGGRYAELKRMASLPFLNIVGGFGKLFSAAKKYLEASDFTDIKSYCDNRYASLNPVYGVLGFSLLGETKYTPHYIFGSKRIRNQRLAKTKQERLSGKTEWELRQEQGYDRIWDVGHKTYLYVLKGTENE